MHRCNRESADHSKEPEKGKKKMLKMKYIGLKTEYDVEFSNLTKNLVQVKGDVPAKTHGFTLSRPGKNDGWDYSAFTTIFRRNQHRSRNLIFRHWKRLENRRSRKLG